MFVYITTVFCCTLLMCVADKLSKKAMVLPFVITFLILFTVSGFRYGVGTDYFFTYVPTYKQIYNGTPPPMEPIFKWLNGLCIDFAGSWYQSIFIVTSFIFIGLVYIAIYNMPCSKALLTVSFLCGGYFLLSLNVVRQTIATALFCCALFLVKRNMDGEKQLQSLFEAFSLVAIAVGFHYSAIIYFAVIPLLYLKLDRKIYLSLFAFFCCSCTYLCCSYWYLTQRDKVWELYIWLLSGFWQSIFVIVFVVCRFLLCLFVYEI